MNSTCMIILISTATTTMNIRSRNFYLAVCIHVIKKKSLTCYLWFQASLSHHFSLEEAAAPSTTDKHFFSQHNHHSFPLPEFIARSKSRKCSWLDISNDAVEFLKNNQMSTTTKYYVQKEICSMESCSCTSTMFKTRDVLPIGSTTLLRLQQSSDDQSQHEPQNRLEIRAQLP